jgi:hypothetical protein
VAFDWEPRKLEEVHLSFLAAEGKIILPLQVKATEVFPLNPLEGFSRMSVLGVSQFPNVHPVIEF